MEAQITRAEHIEFVKRMEEEHNRQNHRISNLEKQVENNNKLLVSIDRLAGNMENMQKEQKKQGERLDKQDERLDNMEARDGEMWRKVTSHVITTIIGIVLGYIFLQIGM